MIKSEFWCKRTGHALIGIALTAVLAACGGGGGGGDAGCSVFSSCGGTPGTPGTTVGVAAKLDIVLSKDALANSGSDSLTATVYAVDSKGVTVANAPVSLSVDKAILTPSGTSTGNDGTVTATITQGSDSTVRTVTVTAVSGTVTSTVSFNVVQSVATSTPQAADLSISPDVSSVSNSGSAVVTITAVAVDSKRNALSGIPIQLSVDSNAIIAVSGSQTDTAGKVTGVVNIGSDHSNRTITVTATSGTLTKTTAFRVNGASMQAPANLVLAPSTAGTVIFKLVDVNQNAMVGQAVAVSATGLPAGSGTTDANGEYKYNFTTPATAGVIRVTGTGGGTSAFTDLTVTSGSSSIPAATQTPSAATPQVFPNVVPVNDANTNNQATLVVNFVDASNKAVANVRVRFDVNDANYTDTSQYGKISQQSVYSDASGNASTSFKPGAIASPTNGQTIRACWKTTDFTSATDCPNQVTSTLTVVSAPVSISIGTDDKIYNGSSTLTYVKKYVVLVVDAAGNPKSDVQITPTLDLAGFAKGQWTWGGTSWVKNQLAVCPAEDLNRNGVIDSTEDVNGNGQLDPRKSDVSISLSGSTKTDSSGVAVIQVEYPKNVAGWVFYKITASAAGVLSPPAYYPSGNPVALPSTQYSGGMNVVSYLNAYDLLVVESSALGSQTAPPAFQYSPYGRSNSCEDPN